MAWAVCVAEIPSSIRAANAVLVAPTSGVSPGVGDGGTASVPVGVWGVAVWVDRAEGLEASVGVGFSFVTNVG